MTGTQAQTALAPRRPVRGYTAVPAAALEAIGEMPCSLYVADAFGGRATLYCARDHAKKFADLMESVRHHDRVFCIRNADQEAFSNRLRAALDQYLEREEVPTADRLAVLRIAVTAGLERAFGLLHVETAVRESHEVGSKIARLLYGEADLSPSLVGIAQHNRDTLTHSINVSILAVALAKQLGFRDEEELAEMAVGAMLHDVGKRHIPARILAKTRPLSPEEKQIVKQHPLRGYEELCGQSSLHFGQLMMIYQHHERMDGNGYPVGIAGDEMHPWARLCSVVDVFEALTGSKPYRDPASDLEAAEQLEAMAGSALDEEAVKCLICEIRAPQSNSSG